MQPTFILLLIIAVLVGALSVRTHQLKDQALNREIVTEVQAAYHDSAATSTHE